MNGLHVKYQGSTKENQSQQTKANTKKLRQAGEIYSPTGIYRHALSKFIQVVISHNKELE